MRPSRSVYRLKTALASALLGGAAAAALAGCQAAPKPAPAPAAPPVASANDTATAQHQFAAIDPNTRVGHVASVSAGDHLAVVTGIPFSDVKVGDPISFTGPDRQPFANGTIQDLDNHSSDGRFSFLVVDYQKASTSGRDPGVGDLAITIPMGR